MRREISELHIQLQTPISLQSFISRPNSSRLVLFADDKKSTLSHGGSRPGSAFFEMDDDYGVPSVSYARSQAGSANFNDSMSQSESTPQTSHFKGPETEYMAESLWLPETDSSFVDDRGGGVEEGFSDLNLNNTRKSFDFDTTQMYNSTLDEGPPSLLLEGRVGAGRGESETSWLDLLSPTKLAASVSDRLKNLASPKVQGGEFNKLSLSSESNSDASDDLRGRDERSILRKAPPAIVIPSMPKSSPARYALSLLSDCALEEVDRKITNLH